MSAEKAPQAMSANGKDDERVESILYRITNGLPRRELQLVAEELTECEVLMLEDISVLEAALEDETKLSEDQLAAVNAMLDSPYTALDRFWSGSALLGRLRNERMLPVSPNALPRQNIKSLEDEQVSLHHLLADTRIARIYDEQVIPSSTLMAIWKKVSAGKAAVVFRRPVKDEEAPGYSDRIVFPMDLSLIRKRIQANNITTLSSLHDAIGLISHNCVKYNGRESEYGQIARDFEALADACIVQALRQASTAPQPAPRPGPKAAPKPALKAPAATTTPTTTAETKE